MDFQYKYQAIYLDIFGSVYCGDQTQILDIDLLVKFSPENKSGLFALSAMRDELQGVLGRKMDLLAEGISGT